MPIPHTRLVAIINAAHAVRAIYQGHLASLAHLLEDFKSHKLSAPDLLSSLESMTHEEYALLAPSLEVLQREDVWWKANRAKLASEARRRQRRRDEALGLPTHATYPPPDLDGLDAAITSPRRRRYTYVTDDPKYQQTLREDLARQTEAKRQATRATTNLVLEDIKETLRLRDGPIPLPTPDDAHEDDLPDDSASAPLPPELQDL